MQGVHYIGDKAAERSNNLLGTDFKTDGYHRFTRERKSVSDFHNMQRQENNQGFDGLRLVGQVASTAPLAGVSRGYQGAKILSAAGARVAGQNALVGAGIGGAQFAENAGQRSGNALLGAIGGVAGGAAGEKIGRGVSKLNQRFSPRAVSNDQVEQTIEIALSQIDDGARRVRLSDLSQQAQTKLKSEVKKLMQQGKSPDAQTLQRMSVFTDLKARGFDLKPTSKQATGNAQIWGKESELAKLDGAEALAGKYSQDHTNLRGLLDDFELKTGGSASDEFQVGDDLFKSLRSQDESRSNYIAALYDQAKNHTGNDLLLDGARLSNNMKMALDQDLVDISLVPTPLLKKIDDFAQGIKPFTLAEKEMLVKQINRRIQGADNQTRFALGTIRSSLEKEVDDSLSGFSSQLQGAAKNAWDDARKAASGRFGLIDRTPALKKALADAEPDKAFEQLVWRGNARELESLIDEIKSNPAILNNIRQAVAKRISDKAIGVNGTFSPKGMSDAIKTIGDRKLSLLFSKDEIKYLKDIEGAGRYLISQPPGANVNHSGTASALMNHLSTFIKLPIVRAAVDKYAVAPSRAIKAQININQGSNPLPATATPIPQAPGSLYDRLVKAGVIAGANASDE